MENENPDYPKWIYLLEGDQFQKYMNFVKTRNFNKILDNPKDQTDTSQPPSYQKPWTEDVTSHPTDLGMHPEGEYSEIPVEKPLPVPFGYLTPEEVKQRRRRTRTYVILGILVLSLVAMMVALLVHFHLQKSLFGSTSSEETVVTTPPPYYQSFTPQETKATKQTPLRSSTNTNNNAVSLGMGTVSLKPLTKPKQAVVGISTLSDDVTTELPEVLSPSVTASNVVATLSDKSFSIECILNGMAAWDYIFVVKLSDKSGDQEVAKVSSQNHETQIETKDTRVEARVVRAGSRTKLVVQLSHPVCTDRGNYMCTAFIKPNTQLSSRFKVALTSPVKKPVLHMPIEVIENKPTSLKVTWYAGLPVSSGDLQIIGLEEEMLTCEDRRQDECASIEKTCELTPQSAINMSTIEAKVVMTTDEGVTSLVSPYSEKLFVVPADVCSHTNERYIQHPYTCGKFIECTAPVLHVFLCPEDACFNSEPGVCIQSATNSSSTSGETNN